MKGAKHKEDPVAVQRTLLEKVGSVAAIIAALAAVGAACGAIYFGQRQTQINEHQAEINGHLTKLQEDVAVVAALNPPGRYIVLYNSGKLNLWLAGFRLESHDYCYRPGEYRLMAVNVGKDATYQIALPEIKRAGQVVRLRLYICDQLGRKWTSEHRVKIDSPNRSPETGKVDSWNTRVWSLPTFRANWSAHYPPNATSRDGETIEGATFDP